MNSVDVPKRAPAGSAFLGDLDSMKLDLEEMFHLAIHAATVGQHHACLGYLKDVLDEQPRHARALYLLAAQHATLGLSDRAIKELALLLEIDPTFEMARFQIGLLLVHRDRGDGAIGHFRELLSSRSLPVARFAEAMLAHVEGRSVLARTLFEQGMVNASDEPALAELMTKFFARPSVTPAEKAAGNSSFGAETIYLGAYGRK